MGFSVSLLLLGSRTNKFYWLQRGSEPLKSCTYWEIETVLSIGRVSAPVNDEGFREKGPRQRAALYFMNDILRVMSRRVNKNPTDCFAPPFNILEVDPREDRLPTVREWEDKFVKSSTAGGEFIHPLLGASIHQQVPSQGIMEKHNKELQKKSDWTMLRDFIMGYPLLWFPCSEVSKWLEKTNTSKISWLKSKNQDKEGQAYFEMWRACVKEMAQVNARILFVFNDFHIPSVI